MLNAILRFTPHPLRDGVDDHRWVVGWLLFSDHLLCCRFKRTWLQSIVFFLMGV
jgi:hypothetical protein